MISNTCLSVFSKWKVKKSRTKPNVLFILADDLGWNDVSWNNPMATTPNLEKLLKMSAQLKNYYVEPICTPTRSVLLTGRSQIHTGLQHAIISPNQPNGIPASETLISEMFKNCFYETVLAGKWHVGAYHKFLTPPYRGFDHFMGFHGGSEDYYTKFKVENKWEAVDFWLDDKPYNGT